MNPSVTNLLEEVHERDEIIAILLEENARLKGHKGRPKIKPSKLENDQPSSSDKKSKKRKRKGKKKTEHLSIQCAKIIQPENIPEGSTLKDYRPFTVQDIEIKLNNVRYFLARWETPSGKILVGKLPNHVKGHFGKALISYILYQNYHNHVTQPLLLEELRELGIKISGAQLNRILIKNKDHFHHEKTNILASALSCSDYINVDDTGTRHKGKNGYVTHIGNEFFAWFESTSSKSRINFLELLRAGHNDYVLNEQALAYMSASGLALNSLAILSAFKDQSYDNKKV